MYLNLVQKLDEAPQTQMWITSPGGDMVYGYAIYDRLVRIKNLQITATGDCSSAALLILQAAERRLATPSTTFTMHLTTVMEKEFDCQCIHCNQMRLDHPPSKEAIITKVHYDLKLFETFRSVTSENNINEALRKRLMGVRDAIKLGFLDEVYYGSE